MSMKSVSCLLSNVKSLKSLYFNSPFINRIKVDYSLFRVRAKVVIPGVLCCIKSRTVQYLEL